MDWSVIYFGFLIGGFQLEDYWAQTVVATANGNARLANPVAIVEKLLAITMGEGEHILVDGLPSLVAKAVGTGIVGIKRLSFVHHGAAREIRNAVLFSKVGIEHGAQNCDFYSFHNCMVFFEISHYFAPATAIATTA